MSTEVVGIVYGGYKGTSRNLEAGGLSFQSSFMPHGGTNAGDLFPQTGGQILTGGLQKPMRHLCKRLPTS